MAGSFFKRRLYWRRTKFKVIECCFVFFSFLDEEETKSAVINNTTLATVVEM